MQGFDEYMNVVMDDAAEVYMKDEQPRRDIGKCSLPLSIYSFLTALRRPPSAKRRQHHTHPANERLKSVPICVFFSSYVAILVLYSFCPRVKNIW